MKRTAFRSSPNNTSRNRNTAAVATPLRSNSNRTAAAFLAMGAIGLLSITPLLARAQETPPTAPPPQITVTARGEVQVAPDRARVQVGVETQAKTAAEAAAENNKKQAAILAAIKKVGVANSQITTLNYNVSPIQRYDDKLRRTVIDGYQVSNIVQVVTDKIEQAGQIIDAGLGNGANRVAGLDFLVKDQSKARDEALTDAVESARRQAEVAAKAAGGKLGDLLELNVNDFERPTPRPMMAMAKMSMDESTPAPISEGMSTVAITVMTRWRFVK